MINRRTLLLSAPAAGLTGSVVAEAQDPHIDWIAEHKAVVAVFEESRSEADDEPLIRRRDELEELICFTPATTARGAASQLEFALSEEANFEMVGDVWKDLDASLMRNVIETLKSLT